MAHAGDLRVEVGEKELADTLVESGWESAPLSEKERALCAYATKLTATPAKMTEDDVIHLRDLGWTDLEIHDACQAIAYFNYVNRLADGLGVDLETEMQASHG